MSNFNFAVYWDSELSKYVIKDEEEIAYLNKSGIVVFDKVDDTCLFNKDEKELAERLCKDQNTINSILIEIFRETDE